MTDNTHGYGVVFQITEAAFNEQLRIDRSFRRVVRAVLPQPFTGRIRLGFGTPRADFHHAVVQPDRITIGLPFANSAILVTAPVRGIIPLEGGVRFRGRVAVRDVPASTGRKEAFLDLTTPGGAGPEDLEVEFSAAGKAAVTSGLTEMGLPATPAVVDGLRGQLKDQMKTVFTTSLTAISLTPGGIAIDPAATGPFAFTGLDARVIDDRGPAGRHALAFLLRSCAGLDPIDAAAFASSAVPAGRQAAVFLSKWALLRCVMRPALGDQLGIAAGSFDGTAACRLGTEVGMSLPGTPSFVLTALEAAVESGLIRIRGGVRKTTWVYEAIGTFEADIRLRLPANPPAGTTGPTIVGELIPKPNQATVTIVWWAWVVAAAVGGVIANIIGVIVALIVVKIANDITKGSFGGALAAGLAARMTSPGAQALGPAADSLIPEALVLDDDLALAGRLRLAATPDTGPRLVVCNSAREPIDSLDLTARLVGSDTGFHVMITNRDSQDLSLNQIEVTEDVTSAFKVGPGFGLPLKVKPGQLVYVPSRFKPPSTGPHSAMLKLISTDPFGPVIADLSARAMPLPPHGEIRFIPPVKFGRVLLKTMAAQPMILKNIGDADAWITDYALEAETSTGLFPGTPAPGGPQFHLPWTMSSPIPPGASRTVYLGYQPTWRGPASATLRIDAWGHSVFQQTLRVGLTGEGGGPVVQLDPPVVEFGANPLASWSTASFKVRNLGDMDLVVSGIVVVMGAPSFLFSPSLAFPMTIAPNGQSTISLSYGSSSIPGAVDVNEFDILTNDPLMPKARLRAVGSAAGPRIRLRPEYIDFGKPPQMPATAAVFVHNDGSTDLDVVYVDVQGAAFRQSGGPTGPFVVAPGQQQQVDVEFIAAAAGTYGGKLLVRSTDARHPLVNVNFIGAR